MTRTNYNDTMKSIKETKSAAHFTAVSVGELSGLGDYVLELGTEVKIPGKVFGGAACGATGAEFSYQVFRPGQETGFYHMHKTHEELYFVLSGAGEMEVDGEKVAVTEGSVVRVAPEGRRTLRNTGSAPMVVLCVQYLAGTFTAADAADGVIG